MFRRGSKNKTQQQIIHTKETESEPVGAQKAGAKFPQILGENA